MNLTFKLVRENATWIVHRARFEEREAYQPDDKDWNDLLELLDRYVVRRKVSLSDRVIVQKLHEEWLRDRHLRDG